MTCWLCGSKTTNLVANVQTPCNAKNGPCEACIAVANLDEEINQAVAALQRLVAKRNDLLSHQNRAHDALHRLPVELRNYIFQLVLPAHDKWGRIARVGKPMSDLLSVCRNWQDLALSNPSFWSTIRIILVDTRTSISDPSNFVHDWILRSRDLPLILHIVVQAGAEEKWRRLLDVISASSNRLHSLTLAIPFDILRDSQRSNLQYDGLRRLQIRSNRYSNQPVPLFNPTMSPEEIDVCDLSFEALKISWNHLTSVTVGAVTMEDITRLFQHATWMTNCCIIDLLDDESVPPIIHQNLKSLGFRGIADNTAMLLDSLTLPCLQDFQAWDLKLLTPAYLPALVHRSGCPLTSITLSTRCSATLPFDLVDLEPLPGVTNLVVERGDELIGQLLLGEYLPDLRYLRLRYNLFFLLWGNGTIRRLLDRNRSLPDEPNKGRLLKVLVADHAQQFDKLWDSDDGEELKALNIILRGNGFEILL